MFSNITMESDYDFAFRLQLEEAMNHSFFSHHHQPSSTSTTSTTSSPPSTTPPTINLDHPLKLCCKGIVGATGAVSGIGIAICDGDGNYVMKVSKVLNCSNGDNEDWKNQRVMDVKCLIDGLNVALCMGVKMVVVSCDSKTLFHQITGKWKVKQHKLGLLLDQLLLIQKKFKSCVAILVAPDEVMLAVQLARDAIDSQATNIESDAYNIKVSCSICLEETHITQVFSIDDCSHRYCFSCMAQCIKSKLLQGMVPVCPYDKCHTQLNLDSCSNFLSPKLIERMKQQIIEASIPVTEKVYCPYQKCSVLMPKQEVMEYSMIELGEEVVSGARKCIKCHRVFCINCKVLWHRKLSCYQYNQQNRVPHVEEGKLKSLAAQNRWRQCVKCNNMIELMEGCYHITCRCGTEFCYKCGAMWVNKKASCTCPLWNERNILHGAGGHDMFDDDDDDFGHDFDGDDF